MSKQTLRKTGGLSQMRRFIIGLLSASATLAVILMAAGLFAAWSFQGPGPRAADGKFTTVNLRQGAGLPEIASKLAGAGVVRSGALFQAAAQITGAARKLKAGEYEFPSGASMADVLAAVRDGKTVRHQITIAEGLTSEMVVELLAEIGRAHV